MGGSRQTLSLPGQLTPTTRSKATVTRDATRVKGTPKNKIAVSAPTVTTTPAAPMIVDVQTRVGPSGIVGHTWR